MADMLESLRYRTLLAPMEGVSHPAFRSLIAKKGGVGMLCTEFVRVSRAPLAIKNLQRSVVKYADVPLSVQVMGNDADKMADAAAHVSDAGADVVDINLGCPMPRVVRKGVGAAILKDPVLLANVVGSMRERVQGVLSAKVRAGFDSSDDVFRNCEILEQVGVDFITVHPRKRSDYYRGVADWRIVRELKSMLSIPVVGNGDLWYAADALELSEQTRCDAVMMGRSAIRNPWIFRQLSELKVGKVPFDPSGDDVLSYLHEVRDSYAMTFSGSRNGGLGKIKEIVRWVGRSLDDEGVFLKSALRASSVDELFRLAESTLSGYPCKKLDLDAYGRFRFEVSAIKNPRQERNQSAPTFRSRVA